MKRGDLVTVALQGDYGKPRPALVIQADQYSDLGSLTVLPVTGTAADAPLLRVPVPPDAESGLRKASWIMVDKAVTVRRDRIGDVIGHLAPNALLEVDRRLAVFLGIAG